MKAKAKKEYIIISSHYSIGSLYFAETDCNDFQAFRRLPNVIEVQGHTLGKSGWNSDHGVAYYRSDKALGKIK